MVASKAVVIAIEAGRTVVLDREEMFANARSAGIAIIGIAPAGLLPHAASSNASLR
jgi:DUF1009 family protein